jgi:FkbM family methyltransferase
LIKKYIDLLKENIKLNNITNVKVIEKGIWSSTKKVKIIPGGMSTKISDKGVVANVTSLDDFVIKEKIDPSKVSFIKMDIEGSEVEAVMGANRILEGGIAKWAIAAYHVVKGEITANYLEKFFKKRGYKIKRALPEHLTLIVEK